MTNADRASVGKKVASQVEPKLAPLTRRESEIVSLVAQGLTNAQIAERLFRSPKTIDKHCRQIYQKLRVRNRVQLVSLATARGLIRQSSAPSSGDDSRPRAGWEFCERIRQRVARVCGGAYLREVTAALCDELGASYAGVTEPRQPDRSMLDILVHCRGSGGYIIDQCPTLITPCMEAMRLGEFLVTTKVAEQFPEDVALTRLGIGSFAGVRLIDPIDGAVGVLWVMNEGPLPDSIDVGCVLRSLAGRTAAELALLIALDSLHASDTELKARIRRVSLDEFVEGAMSLESAGDIARSARIELTRRELEVLTHLAAGLSNQDIAAQLYRSTKTVEKHVLAIYRKLGVHNRVQALGRAQELGLLESKAPPATPPLPLPEPEHASQIKSIQDRTADTAGADYLLSLIRALTDVLDVAFAGVSELADYGETAVGVTAFARDTGSMFLHECQTLGTLCGTSISSGSVLVARDLKLQFPADQSVEQLGIRAHAGVGLRDPLSGDLGTLWVADTREHHDGWDPRPVLAAFAGRVTAELALMRTIDEHHALQEKAEPDPVDDAPVTE